jgi:hypothetical protein
MGPPSVKTRSPPEQPYQQHPNDEWTTRALDLIDRWCAENIVDAGNELKKFER